MSNAVNPSYRNRTAFKVTFPGSPITTRTAPKQVRVYQRPASHDVATFGLHTPDNLYGVLPGAPVIIEWGNWRGQGQFHGYVYKVEPTYEGSNAIGVNLICVGASYPLMNRGTDTWVEVTAPDVVRDIASRHGLAFDVEAHPRVYGQIAQAGESYWQLLRRLADETGYVLRVEGSTIIFRSRNSMTQHFRPIAPVLKMIRSKHPGAQGSADIINFTVKSGEFTPEEGSYRATRHVHGVDPKTGEALGKSAQPATPFRSDINPVFTEPLVHAVVNNQSELDAATQAAQERHRFTRFAEMTTWGEPYLAPERIIYATGMSSEYAGHWTVRSVVHTIDGQNYKCQVELGTDGLGASLGLVGEAGWEGTGRLIPVDPHRLPGLSWPYSAPVLESSSRVIGIPGQAMADFAWVAPVTNWSAA